MYAFAPVKRDQSPFDAFFASSQPQQKPERNADFSAALSKSQETANTSGELNARTDASKRSERETVERRSREKDTKDAKEARESKEAEKAEKPEARASTATDKAEAAKARIDIAITQKTLKKEPQKTVHAERGVSRGEIAKKASQEKKSAEHTHSFAESAAVMNALQQNTVKVQKKPVMEAKEAKVSRATEGKTVQSPGQYTAPQNAQKADAKAKHEVHDVKEAKASVGETKNTRERIEKAKTKNETAEAPRTENDKPTELTVTKQKDMTTPATTPVTDAKVNAQVKAEALQPLAKFQDILPQLVDRAQVMMSEGKSEITMTLKPEALGDVKMKFSLEGDTLVGDITVDSAAVKDIFDRNIDSVIQSLSDMNITVSQFSVTLKNDAEADYAAYEREFAKKSLSIGTDVPMNDTETVYALYGRTLDLII
ncbi:MAG: flagellar hook-length control protein FliK [Spirochaetota bacterium]